MPMSIAKAADLTVVGWGGSYQDSQKKAYFEPFAKETGVNIKEDSWSGEIAKIRAMVETKSITWNVIDADSRTAVQGCNEGVFETIDWTKLGVDRSKLITADKYDCAVPTIFYSQIVAYDSDKTKSGPQTIADLFDLKKFPGKRGLQKNPFLNLEWALIADGVAAKDVYKVLRTQEGVDRAFKKLDTIKSDVVWWESSAQPAQLLADGQVVMTSAYNGRIADANKKEGKHFGILWDAQGLDSDLWIIPKGSPNLDEAYKFLAFASSPKAQAEQTRYISYGPANQDAVQFVDPAITATLPTAPDHMGDAILVDADFWGEMGDQLRTRFTAWLAQ
ncbi:polyamine ABC transporter substrate-binding protein [Labrys okinawensis]|uniref:polyamine ABC transporter substrate-binding protein n=1 Tax=Labrys okinawensis TaxID=346911 RepID=UPI0039BC3561